MFICIGKQHFLEVVGSSELATYSLVIGALVCVVACLSFCLAFLETKSSAIANIIILLILLISMLGLGISLTGKYDSAIKGAGVIVGQAWHEPNEFNSMDKIQSLIRCCGLYSFKDYLSDTLPASCCDFKKAVECGFKEAFKVGCSIAVERDLEITLTYLIVLVFVLAIVYLGGVVLTCFIGVFNYANPTSSDEATCSII